MNSHTQTELGAALLRVSLGIVMIAHSLYLKLFIFTLAGTAQFFGSIGLPEFLAYIVFTIETIAGLSLILGYKTKWASLSLIPVLLGATWAHWESGWLFVNEGGGWEYPLLLTILALIQFLLGSGDYSLDKNLNIKKSHPA